MINLLTPLSGTALSVLRWGVSDKSPNSSIWDSAICVEVGC